MKNPKTINEAAAIEAVKKILHNGSGYEAALEYLRACNYGQIDSIKVMQFALGITLREAKELIHYSRTWEDRRATAEVIHEVAFRAVEDIKRENPE